MKDEQTLNLRPIGVIRSPLTTRPQAPKQGTEGAPDAWLEIADWAEEALRGIAPGDRLLFYSDGFTECTGPDGQMLEEDGFARLIHANAFRMAVAIEGIPEAIARIEGQGDGPPTAFRRVVYSISGLR